MIRYFKKWKGSHEIRMDEFSSKTVQLKFRKKNWMSFPWIRSGSWLGKMKFREYFWISFPGFRINESKRFRTLTEQIWAAFMTQLNRIFQKRQLNENGIHLARFVFDHFHSLLKQDLFTAQHNKKKSYVLCDCTFWPYFYWTCEVNY